MNYFYLEAHLSRLRYTYIKIKQKIRKWWHRVKTIGFANPPN